MGRRIAGNGTERWGGNGKEIAGVRRERRDASVTGIAKRRGERKGQRSKDEEDGDEAGAGRPRNLIGGSFYEIKYWLNLRRLRTLSPETHNSRSMAVAAAARSGRQVGGNADGSLRRAR